MDKLPERLIQCNCSICRRYASLWGHLTRNTARVSFEQGAASAYMCNDKELEFYHCNTCGCATHYESIEKTDDARLSVNFRMFEPGDIEKLELRTFDGAVSFTLLDD